MAIFSRALLLASLCLPALAQAAPITLDDAITRALAAAPQRAVAEARTEAWSAARRAADTKPAPTIEVAVENIGPLRGALDQSQVDFLYSQRIERGGKRAARIALVDREQAVSSAEAIVTRLDTVQQAQRLFVEAQSATIKVEAVEERLRIARELQKAVAARVASARDPIFAGTRARTQVTDLEVELEVAIHERDRCLTRLAELWGGTPDGLTVPTDSFLEVVHEEEPHLPSPSDLALFQARVARAEAAFDVERAAAVIDPTVTAGPRLLTGTGDVALVAGVSIPLANKRLNAANSDRAEALRRQAEAELAVERYQRNRAIDQAAEEVEEAQHAALAIRDRVLPGLRQTLAEVRAGYARGGFSFLDVSTAASAVAEARGRVIEAATRFHLAKVTLDRLTGEYAKLVSEAR